jgi:hypothetical protein
VSTYIGLILLDDHAVVMIDLNTYSVMNNELVKSALKIVHTLVYNSNSMEKKLHIKSINKKF